MLLIACGCDTTGKTTLVNALAERLDYDVVKGSSFEITGGKNQEELFEAFMELTALENTILDRYIYSNEVYSPLYNDYSCLNDEQRRFIEREVQGATLIIYLSAPVEVIKERFRTRGEDYVDEDKIETILHNYEESLNKSNLTILRYDTSQSTTEEIVESIIEYIN